MAREIKAITYVETSSWEDDKSAMEAFRLCSLSAKASAIGAQFRPQLKKATSLSTLTRCKSMLKLRKCKSRADFGVAEKIDEMDESESKNCSIM